MDPSVKYPYGVFAKLVHYPWANHWKRGRFFRYMAYSLVVTWPVFYLLHKGVNSPGNVAMWEKIRKARYHDPFEAPTEHGKPHH